MGYEFPTQNTPTHHEIHREQGQDPFGSARLVDTVVRGAVY